MPDILQRVKLRFERWWPAADVASDSYHKRYISGCGLYEPDRGVQRLRGRRDGGVIPKGRWRRFAGVDVVVCEALGEDKAR